MKKLYPSQSPSLGALPHVAVLIPCYNEAIAIAKVVRDFRQALPHATIYVYDNNSQDDTAAIARQAGAHVFHVALQGKGNVVRRQFADIQADIYLIVDGDDTYDAHSAAMMIATLIDKQHDMVVAIRQASLSASAFRAGHIWGNYFFMFFLECLFGYQCRDIFSGYRVLSRRFVKSFPVLSEGFEIEMELAIHSLEMKMSVGEVVTPFRERPKGSFSKLRTYQDGLRVLLTMIRLFYSERPFLFFGALCCLSSISSVLLALPVVFEFWRTGLVPRLPTAIFAMGLMLAGLLSAVTGLILDMVACGRHEAKILAYLQQPVTGHAETAQHVSSTGVLAPARSSDQTGFSSTTHGETEGKNTLRTPVDVSL